jgi:diguanylate cyclase (GGDEF)-like protein
MRLATVSSRTGWASSRANEPAGVPPRARAVSTGRLGLRLRLVLWFVFLAGAAVLGATFTSVRATRAELAERVDTDLSVEASRVADALRERDGSTDLGEVFTELIGSHPPAADMMAVALLDSQLVASHGSPDVVEAVTSGADAGSAPVDRLGFSTVRIGDDRFRALDVRVVSGAERGDYVLLRSLDDATAAVDDTIGRLIVVALLVLTAAAVAAWGTISRTLRPVRVLSQTARRISDDALGDRLEVSGGDEVADLARTFNEMLDRLEAGIRARDEYARHLHHAATHDPLTRAQNRLAFYRAVDRIGEPAHGDLHAVLLIDLDGFKAVNDIYGHAAGDALLIELATRVQDMVRPQDTFARLGGDEFALLCDGLASTAEAETIARRIHVAISRPVQVGAIDLTVTASIGVATSPDRNQVSQLLGRADRAMYHAKTLHTGVASWPETPRAARRERRGWSVVG